MSEQSNTQTTSTPTSENSQASQATALTSELSSLSRGVQDTPVSNAVSSVEHKADPLSVNTPKQNEQGKDIAPTPATNESEEYEIELSDDSPLSEEDLNEIAAEASRLNLSKEDAQKLLALKESTYKKALTIAEQKQLEKINTAKKEILSHPDFTGDNKIKTFESINRVVEKFGDENLVKALNTPEIGNNLAIALFLKKIGDLIAPDSFEGKGALSAQNDSKEAVLKTLYPSFYKN